MGAWGTGIFSSDTACDVRDEYRALLEDQVPDIEATRIVVEKYGGPPDDEELWLALAAAQWKLGRLEPDVMKRAIDVIDAERGMDLWEGPQITTRRAALAKLRAQLTSPQPSRKTVRRSWRYQTDLRAGDAIATRVAPRATAVLRVVSLTDDHAWVTPNLEVLIWKQNGVPSPGQIDELSPVTGRLPPSLPWRICATRLRKRDPDWREAGFELIATGDGIDREHTRYGQMIVWDRLARDLTERFRDSGLA